MDVRLPAGETNVTMVYLSVRVRDQYGCGFEFDVQPASITRDTTTIAMLMDTLQSTSSRSNATNQLNSNALVQALVNGNQNEINQGLVSLSQMLNTMSTDALQTALMNAPNIHATTLSVSSLDRTFPQQFNSSSPVTNTTSALGEYNQQRNQVATVLDYLVVFVSNLAVGGADSIALQSSTLAEVTKSTSALTRDATVRPSLILTRLLVSTRARSLYRHNANDWQAVYSSRRVQPIERRW